MPSPADAQAALAALLLRPAAPAPAGLLTPGTGQQDLVRRLAVHRNTVTVTLVDALAATYPAVQALTGRDFFRVAAREFLRRQPPRSPVLAEYGAAFPDFLAAFPPAGGVPYLPDVARLEWAWAAAYGAADVTPAGIEILAGAAAGGSAAVRLRLHPSVAVLSSRFPIVSLWAQTTGRAEQGPLDLSAGETALVARPGVTVEVHGLQPGSAAFLSALLQGASLGMAAEAAMAAPGFDLQAEIAALFDAGLVVGCREVDRHPKPKGVPE